MKFAPAVSALPNCRARTGCRSDRSELRLSECPRKALSPARINEKTFGERTMQEDSPLPTSPDSPIKHEGEPSTRGVVPEKPQLTADQEMQVLRYTARRVAEGVLGGPATAPQEMLSDAGNVLVWGAFVSLKRGSQLRACCGHIGGAYPLVLALNAAAERASRWDLRLPPITPDELSELEIEVWLLWNLRRVEAQGEARLAAVEIGRHGLQVVRGQHRGLLLPGVAVEHNLGPRQFLEQVCRKAGLPGQAWLEPGTELFTFDGYALREQLGNLLPEDLKSHAKGKIGLGDVARLAAFAHQNLIALFQGATPSFYTSAAYDGPVQGLVLTVKRTDPQTQTTERIMEASRVFARGELPLQATLMDLLQTVVAGFRGQHLDPRSVEGLEMGLTVFVEPHLIGTVADCVLEGVDPRFHAICVSQDERWAVRYDPTQTPEDLLRKATERLKSPRSSQCAVYRLTVRSTEGAVEASTVTRPVAGPSVRPPAVAGQFYPGTANGVDEMLARLLPPERTRENCVAALVPHAGWRYSGRLAAEVWARLYIPERVIIVGPKHHAVGSDWAVTPHRTWALPGLSLHADPELARGIAEAVPFMELDAAAHAAEHAIEVQLPIVARVASGTRVVGIVMHGGDYDTVQRAAAEFAKFLDALPQRPLLVISSDMNHYADENTTRQRDRLALDALVACDPRQLWKTVRENRISMCGIVPAVFVLETLKELGLLKRCEIVGYTTSAEVSGQTERVVGYAGAVFTS